MYKYTRPGKQKEDGEKKLDPPFPGCYVVYQVATTRLPNLRGTRDLRDPAAGRCVRGAWLLSGGAKMPDSGVWSRRNRCRGSMLALLGVMMDSPDALVTRHLARLDSEQAMIIFYKYLFTGIMTLCVSMAFAGGPRQLWRGLLEGPAHVAAASTCQVVPTFCAQRPQQLNWQLDQAVHLDVCCDPTTHPTTHPTTRPTTRPITHCTHLPPYLLPGGHLGEPDDCIPRDWDGLRVAPLRNQPALGGHLLPRHPPRGHPHVHRHRSLLCHGVHLYRLHAGHL